MSSVTIFVSKDKKSDVGEFPSDLEKLLKSMTNQRRIDVTESLSPDCSPAVIIAMYDFGGNTDLPKKLEDAAKVFASQHFGISSDQVNVTVNGTFSG